jgi:triosephosphate isomerase
MSKRIPLVAGNWKMNGSRAANAELLNAVTGGAESLAGVELVVCPPFVYLPSVAAAVSDTAVGLGAQNLSDQEKPGAYTGEVLGAMLVEVGCRYVIVGHSERRSYYGENNELVARKTRAAIKAGLRPIVCVGETLAERDGGQTDAVLKAQIGAVLDSGNIAELHDFVIAYEPVWAIGTGRTATPEQAQQAHALLRSEVRARDAKLADSVRILYGGSVKADNAASLFGGDVDGGLIGGASLKAADFLAIARAAL